MSEASVEVVAVSVAFIGAVFISMESILGKRGTILGAPPLLASFVAISVTAVVFLSASIVLNGLSIVRDTTLAALGIFFLAGALNTGIGMIALYQGVDRVGASISTAIVNSR